MEELSSIANRWQLLRNDFDTLSRESPGIWLDEYSSIHEEQPIGSLAIGGFWLGGVFRQSGWLVHMDGTPVGRVRWLMQRSVELFERDPSAVFFEKAGPPNYEMYASVQEFTDFYRERKSAGRRMFPGDKWTSFLLWFGGYENGPIQLLPRLCRDACSYLTDEAMKLITKSHSLPAVASENEIAFVPLSIKQLAKIFDCHRNTIRSRLQSQAITNKKIQGSNSVKVSVFDLPEDWKNRLAQQ